MLKRYASVLFASSVFMTGLSFAADELPTIKQVYESAHAGHLDDALKMMERVLAAQPNSAKAHFVEAELLAEQKQYVRAKSEFETAARLDPVMAFAKPEAIQKLKSAMGIAPSAQASGSNAMATSGIPWTPILILAGIVGLVIVVIVAMRKRSAASTSPNNSMIADRVPGPLGNAPYSPTPGYPAGAPGMAPAAGGGLGSSMMTGLATGAAVGVGMVAAEALAHRFFDGDHAAAAPQAAAPAPVETASASSYDMGGNDFGLVDNSQWDNTDVGSVSDSGGDWS